MEDHMDLFPILAYVVLTVHVSQSDIWWFLLCLSRRTPDIYILEMSEKAIHISDLNEAFKQNVYIDSHNVQMRLLY